MELSGEQTFTAPRQRVWDLLLDPETLRSCLPGCERLEAVGPDEYEATMKIGVAAIRGTYQGRVKISDRNEPASYRMLVEGKGPAGQVSGEGELVLVEDGVETKVQYAGKATVRGTLARVGGRVMQPAAKLVVGQFFNCLSARLDK
ncbi:MAG: carbon monoxide dehydrogenase subunit G [Chloroflexia bacterium]|nr:carbon monoxide dehydrogenase subunit G [Chloroflexia bacterium]MDQ3411985.1 carbon monoxide dehydrogenase subunit G [Chloroflexota bacterium]